MENTKLKQEFGGEYKYGFHDEEKLVFKSPKGLNEKIVRQISEMKNEPAWMLERRLAGLKHFDGTPLPKWGSDLSGIDFKAMHYYGKPAEKQFDRWEDVPEEMKNTFDKLGIPQAEQKFLAGVGAQYDSEVIYHKIRKDLEEKGVVFTDMDSGLREYEGVVKKFFGSVVPTGDNKFAALNTAVWSGGSFVFVPKDVKVEIPLQAYFRINAKNLGQFERTLIIAEPGSSVHYIEGCSAPVYSTDALHSAVVEIIAMEGANVRYTTIQNWSNDVYNLVTKRAKAFRNARVEWVDGNIGSKVTMKYPCIMLMEEGARGEVTSIAFAGKGQKQDAGAKIYHLAPNTFSNIISKSISKDGGRTVYRGTVSIGPNANNSKCNVECDALILDGESASDTVPYMTIANDDVSVSHEASVSKIDEEKLFYMESRGFSEEEAKRMLVQGFISPFIRQLPLEYAVELNRLIDLEMEGSVG
ncbi:MAG: Fe-S cluster assembly protein SufB [Candidatus Diapherotrites archaeon]|nr:Fe-S cluster assembly protein SufB [Candidatus Diapherotrites archaeon]